MIFRKDGWVLGKIIGGMMVCDKVWTAVDI